MSYEVEMSRINAINTVSNIRERITSAMTEKKMSISMLSAETQISIETLENMLCGSQDISIRTLGIVASALGLCISFALV